MENNINLRMVIILSKNKDLYIIIVTENNIEQAQTIYI